MSETTTQMQDFLTRQAKVCHDNCEIEKDLYKELGVKRGTQRCRWSRRSCRSYEYILYSIQ